MKKLLCILVCLIFSIVSLYAQQIGGKFQYTASYKDGKELNYNITSHGSTSLTISLFELPGAPVKLIVSGTSVTPWGATNVWSLPMGGDNHYTYAGSNNGWYVFTWGSQTLLIHNSNTVVRLVPISNQNCYAEYRKN